MVDGLSRLRFMNVDRTRLDVHRRIQPRGVPAALHNHPVLDTEDLVEATDATSQFLGHCQVTPEHSFADRPGEGFHCRLNAVQLLDVTMAYLDFAVATTVHVPQATTCFTVHMTSAGQAQARIKGVTHELTPYFALVISPDTDYHLHLDHDSPQTIIRIEQKAVERQLSRMLGRRLTGPVVFEPVADLTTDTAARWHGALQILFSEVLSEQSLVRQGYGAGSLEELIVSTLLYMQPSNYSETLRSRPRRSGRAAVTRSIEFIERHLAEPISLEDIASYARMSPRSVQVGFREDLGTTPITFVRDRRLDAVRRTLLEAAPHSGVTVTETATRWGFTHLGNFSGAYRQRFGETPSHTLRGFRSA
ncbi:AraC family transcriptional regulator [Nocardioides salsibiostraticola]